MGGPERGSGDGAAASSTPAVGATDTLPDALAAAFDHLEGAIDEVLDSDAEELTRPQLQATLRRLQPQLDRVHWYRSRLAGVLAEHARARQGSGPAGHADERAKREAASFLRSELQLSDSEAKRAVTAGQQARTSPSVNQATRDGRLNPEQVTTIARLLADVEPAVRAQLEADLLDAAGRMDAVALGRFGRGRLLELDPDEGERRERRQHARRAFRLTQTSDGAVIPSGRLYGAQAEVAMAAWHAFRRPDAPGEVRTPEQRGADAFEQLCAVALRVGEAPTQHGERPQLLVVADQQVLLDGAGVVELGFTGPVSLTAVRCLLSDCSVSRIGLGDQPVSVAVSKKVRTVPAGLWRALIVRDGGCTWRGCDAPAAWCDVAHGEQSYEDEGRLGPSNAALLCRRHHRAYDHGPYVMLIDDDGVRYVRDPGAEVVAHEAWRVTVTTPSVPPGETAGDRDVAMPRAGAGRPVTVRVPAAAPGTDGAAPLPPDGPLPIAVPPLPAAPRRPRHPPSPSFSPPRASRARAPPSAACCWGWACGAVRCAPGCGCWGCLWRTVRCARGRPVVALRRHRAALPGPMPVPGGLPGGEGPSNI